MTSLRWIVLLCSFLWTNLSFGQKTASSPQDADAGLRQELGAATIVPADAAFFVNERHPARQWAAGRDSRAFKKLMALDFVRDGLADLAKNPDYKEFNDWKDKDPIVASALKILPDLLSEEIFVYAGADWIAFSDACGEIQMENFGAAFLDGLEAQSGRLEPPGQPLAVVTKILELKDRLKVPSLIVGAAVSHPEDVRKLLEDLVKAYPKEAPPLSKERIGEGEFHVLRLSTRMVPERDRSDIQRALV